ncbi:hypothetical protein C2S52_015898 [Perilla frutescens var. hirtella]|nr:hypothetical protein C2S52_015898 [Perilla frutescens var. hirtella]KAH6815312.1 hypothetical protein C2S51_020132 [Perilla frutescens var. frutescens]
MMKGKLGSKLKQIASMVSCVTRAKCMAVRSKADAMKARLMLTSLTLLSTKKKFSIAAISAKINHAVDGMFRHRADDDDVDVVDDDDLSKAIVIYNKNNKAAAASCCRVGSCDVDGGETVEEFDGDDKYPDLRHSLFEEEEEQELAELLDDPNSSISAIDMVKNSKEEEGESFNLEDEIDEVADLFITKFHKRMRLQKLLSFKRHQQMLHPIT